MIRVLGLQPMLLLSELKLFFLQQPQQLFYEAYWYFNTWEVERIPLIPPLFLRKEKSTCFNRRFDSSVCSSSNIHLFKTAGTDLPKEKWVNQVIQSDFMHCSNVASLHIKCPCKQQIWELVESFQLHGVYAVLIPALPSVIYSAQIAEYFNWATCRAGKHGGIDE